MKVKIEINQSTYDKIKQVYDHAKDAYQKMNLNSVDDFIGYILENFSSSSAQFEKLNDQMKMLMENINLEDFSFEDLFKNIAKTSLQKNDKKLDNMNNNSNISEFQKDNNKKS